MKRLEDLTEPELSDLLNAMGRTIEATASYHKAERPLFALILFNDPALGQYICNCERSEVIKALRETADRLESRQDIPR